MKKILAAALSLLLILGLAACSSNGGSANTGEGGSFRVAIVKQMDHASLDEIADAISAQLDVLAGQKNMTIEYRVFSGQNDATMLGQIGTQVTSDGYDLVIPIATLSAQMMATAAEGTGIPVVFAAVSDPETAGLTGLDYVTGVSDALDTTKILDMMFALNPEIGTVGLLYSLSEPNSTAPIEAAREYLNAKEIPFIAATGNNNEEIMLAASSLAPQVDAIFTPTDNIVMATELTISELFAVAGVPHYAGADSFVRNGAFATCGVNYGDLGAKAADMAVAILAGGSIGDYQTIDGGVITVNTETAEALGLDYSAFSSMGTVVEVATTAE